MVRKISENKKYATKKLDINWDKQIQMAVWKKIDAQKLYAVLEPLVGHIFVLYGGGGQGHNVVRLNSVRAEPWAYYSEGSHSPVPTKKNEYRVGVSLSAVEKEDTKSMLSMFSNYSRKTHTYRAKRFAPWLGSWKLLQVIEVK